MNTILNKVTQKHLILNTLYRLGSLLKRSKALAWVVLLALPAGMFAQGDKAVIDRVVASVGGEIILLSEIQEQFAYAKQQQPNLPDEYRCITMQNLVVQKMLVNQAKLDSIKLTDEEVENQLTARIDRLMLYFNQDQKALEEY